MKKIVNSNGSIRIEEAESSTNGISFRISKEVGNFARVCAQEYFTSIDKDGNIFTRAGNAIDEYKEVSKNKDKKRKIVTIVTYTLLIAIMVAVLCLMPDSRGVEVLTGLLIFGLGTIRLMPVILIFVLAKLGDKEYASFMRYHAAEHAVINGYYDLHRVPNLEEIKQYSNWSYGCGSLQVFSTALPFLSIGIARIIASGIWYIPFAIVVMLIDVWLLKTRKLCFLEALITSTPTEKEYQVAICGLDNSLKMLAEMDVDEDEITEAMLFMETIIKELISPKVCEQCPNRDSCKDAKNK